MICTIDNDNDIRAHETEAQAEEAAKAATGSILVRSEKELAKAAADWPASRLLELWNSFAGVAPFTDCKPVKKFENRDKAVGRIWTTIQRLGNAIEPKPAEQAKPPHEIKPATGTKKAGKTNAPKPTPKGKATKGKKAAACTSREGTHKAQVIAMLQRKGGATLDAIMEATGWQKHTVRGFISILGKKGGMKVTNTRRESDGARVYGRRAHRRMVDLGPKGRATFSFPIHSGFWVPSPGRGLTVTSNVGLGAVGYEPEE
jgi:Protein of unknown function (DUF3489)